jgi:hypothetical protein
MASDVDPSDNVELIGDPSEKVYKVRQRKDSHNRVEITADGLISTGNGFTPPVALDAGGSVAVEAAARIAGDGLRVLKAGDTMTGPLTYASDTSSARNLLVVNGDTSTTGGQTPVRPWRLIADESFTFTQGAVTQHDSTIHLAHNVVGGGMARDDPTQGAYALSMESNYLSTGPVNFAEFHVQHDFLGVGQVRRPLSVAINRATGVADVSHGGISKLALLDIANVPFHSWSTTLYDCLTNLTISGPSASTRILAITTPGAGASAIRLDGQQTSLEFRSATGSNRWLIYSPNTTDLYFRDTVNGRMHISLFQGASSQGARMDINSRLYVANTADMGSTFGVQSADVNRTVALLKGAVSQISPLLDVQTSGGISLLTIGIAKPDVSGSRAGNAALASVLTVLAGLNLLTDSTTA